MTSRTTALGQAIRYALATTATLAALPAFAQSSSTASPTNLDRIEITGSRIRQVDVETSQPVLALTRADIERQGFSSVSDILQNVTAMGSPTISRANVLSAGEDAGGTYVNMRNLGTQRTLVLVNGKRLGISTSGYQDVSTLPVSAVERIEVLKDGASAIYGSDAMAGVINIITRTNVNGVTANVYHGQYSEGDGARDRVDVVAGWSNDRFSATFAAEHSEEKAVWARDRGFSRYGNTDRHPTDGWTTNSQWGQFYGVKGGPGCTKAAGCDYALNRGTDPTNPANYHFTDPTAFTGDVSNTNEQMHLSYPIKRDSLYFSGTANITDNVRFKAELGYNKRSSTRVTAGYPFDTATAKIKGMSVDSYFNPFGNQHGYAKPTEVSWNRRLWEVPRTSTSELKTYRAVAAFEGSFDIGERYFDWEVGYQYNKNELRQSTFGNLHKGRVEQATGKSYLNPATGKVECGAPGAPIANCMPWNPLIPYGVESPYGMTNNQALQDWLFPPENATGRTTSKNAFATISGSLFTLPAGDLGFAFGVENREETGKFVPDPLAQTGATTNLAAGPTGGSYKVKEAYLELNVPVLADLPGARELSLNAATRFSDYNTFGNTLNSKFGFKWKPIDQLLVRGTWAQGFRAPTISDLYGGGSETFANFSDPCDSKYGSARSSAEVRARCARDIADVANFRQLDNRNQPTEGSVAATPTPFTSGSNPDLKPETSTSRTLGVVWSPTFISNFNVSLDWWKIRIDDTIVDDSPNQILIDCYEQGLADRCARFTRNATTGIVTGLKFGNRNAGFMETEGYDMDLTYRLDTDYGKLSTSWSTTYVAKDVFRSSNDSTIVPTVNNGIATNTGIGFRVRSNLTVGWDLENFGVSWTARYYSSVKEQCVNPGKYADECSDLNVAAPWYKGTRNYNERGSVTFHDVQFRYNLPWDATVSVGANNVFDKQGPVMYTKPRSVFSYYGGYDIGRFIYMKYTQRF
ncbi:MAG: TonB-dependent receptor domain-containing protein [Stenotrophomonas indicatrix]|jgi:iron complex outermembrane receptor protein|uniref:TonB-dependent receptor n=1 Tax=Stenotrophomonas indicatrix TaxID=2045451 RepID=A0ABT8Q9W0_9GAMM|nr:MULTISPECIES: TonB-dependent receptor [Stenotrophomonas]PJL11748.1 TonB-dependent receptor [Stenotrophomonas maltophilia]AVJ32074.1 TonB-dependent receptor [Stenotrophomonas sp. MYb57]EZP43752.1 Btub9 protein [Stenotrophomonas sp. RIT309]MCK6232050.1 TonB-dependent receptor [Stenotrophomonas indicatrix]MDN8663050.1 TonB-dependent receptor [Stenotrophomonas indicatrix]